jgi:hypothetical protein
MMGTRVPTFRITAENSRSAMRSFASPCFSMNAMASGSRRVLRVFSTAPHIGTPKCASYIAGMFGSMTATVSPVPMPRFASAEASRRQRS